MSRKKSNMSLRKKIELIKLAYRLAYWSLYKHKIFFAWLRLETARCNYNTKMHNHQERKKELRIYKAARVAFERAKQDDR